jgi:integrase
MKQRTDIHFRKAAPRDFRYELPDRDGLVLEIQPSGKRTWRYRYRFQGKREKVTLGPYPAISLEEARDMRREAEKLVIAGVSPATQKQQKRRELATATHEQFATVTKLARHWIEVELKPANKRPDQDTTYIERDIVPVIGERPPSSITPKDIWVCVEAVRTRGHGQAARRVLSVLRRVFAYGQAAGCVQNNPATAMRPKQVSPTVSRSRKLSDQELRQFDSAIESSRLATPMRCVLRFLLLVPARKGELVQARWDEIDMDAGTWTIPEHRSKNGMALVQKLPPQAMSLLRELQTMASKSEWVIPSPKGRGKKHLSLSALNAALKTVQGMPSELVIHDLRRTVRTGLGELEVPDAVAELCLNHRKGGVGGVYDRAERLEPRYVALCQWADWVDRATGRTNVTPFRVPRQPARSASAKA